MRFVVSIAAMLATASLFAQPAGTLDPTFGTGGKVITSTSTGQDKAYGVVPQHDAKILVAGYSTNPISGKDFSLVRYNSDGTLDNTFGTNGVVNTNLQQGSDDVAYGLALQADGKIVLGGYSDDGSSKDAALVRYNSNGTLDNTFGMNGIVLTDFEASQSDEIKAVKIHPATGNIIVGGASNISNSIGKPVLARYTSTGSLDLTFNSTGIKLLWVATNDNNRIFSVEDLVVESNGKISCTGWRKQVSTSIITEYWAARVLSNGNMDANFSGDGVLSYTDVGSNSAYGLVLNSNQDFTLCGFNQYYGDNAFRTVKISQTGVISTPKAYIDFYQGTHKAQKIAVDNNGQYIVVGTSNNAFAVMKINPTDLAEDYDFGASATGFTTTTFGSTTSECYNLAIQSDNKIIAVGCTGGDFAIARYTGTGVPQLNNFQLITPANNAVNQSFTSLGFDWSNAFGATSYQMELSNFPTFISPYTFTVTSSTISLTNLQANTQYYWRVRASDGTNWGNYSTAWTFRTNTLGNFNLISPANNTTNQSFASVSFDWSDEPAATAYELDLDTTQSFNSSTTFGVTSSTLSLNGLLPNTQYYWRVRAAASNWNTYGPNTSTWTFRTNTLENFNLIRPADNANNQTYTSLGLDWSDNPDAVSYELQIDTTANFAAASTQTFTTTISAYSANLASSKTYYWRVRASDGNVWGQWTNAWRFTTQPNPALAVEESKVAVLKIYPNPSSDLVNIEVSPALLNQSYKLLDYAGKELQTGIIQSERFTIDLDKLSEGVYFVQIGYLSAQTYKIIKK